MIPEIVLKAEIDQAIRARSRGRAPAPVRRLARRATGEGGAERGARNVATAFVLRKPQFILNTVKIEKYDFATKRNPTAFRLKIDDARMKGGCWMSW